MDHVWIVHVSGIPNGISKKDIEELFAYYQQTFEEGYSRLSGCAGANEATLTFRDEIAAHEVSKRVCLHGSQLNFTVRKLTHDESLEWASKKFEGSHSLRSGTSYGQLGPLGDTRNEMSAMKGVSEPATPPAEQPVRKAGAAGEQGDCSNNAAVVRTFPSPADSESASRAPLVGAAEKDSIDDLSKDSSAANGISESELGSTDKPNKKADAVAVADAAAEQDRCNNAVVMRTSPADTEAASISASAGAAGKGSSGVHPSNQPCDDALPPNAATHLPYVATIPVTGATECVNVTVPQSVAGGEPNQFILGQSAKATDEFKDETTKLVPESDSSAPGSGVKTVAKLEYPVDVISDYCMTVTPFNHGYCDQFLELTHLYFEDMAGDILKACRCGNILIYFKNAEALKKALVKTVHTIDDGLTVYVRQREPCSPPPPGISRADVEPVSKDSNFSRLQERTMDIKDSVTSKNVASSGTKLLIPVVVSLANEAMTNYVQKDGFSGFLKCLQAKDCSVKKVKVSGVNLILSCMVASDTMEDQLHQIVDLVQTFMSQLSSSTIVIAKEMFESIQPDLAKLLNAEALYLSVDNEKSRQMKHFTVAGKTTDVEQVMEQLHVLIRGRESENLRQSHQTAIKKPINAVELELLLASEFVQKMKHSHPDVKMQLDKSGFVELTGLSADVYKVLDNLYKRCRKMKKGDYVTTSRLVADCFHEQWFLEAVQRKWSKASIAAVLQASASLTVTVWSSSEHTIDKAVQIVREAVTEHSFAIAPEARHLMATEAWVLSIISDASSHGKSLLGTNALSIAVLTDTLPDVKVKVEAFLKNNTPVTKTVSADFGKVRYIMRYKRGDIEALEKQYDQSSEGVALIITDSPSVGFTVKGNARGVNTAESLLTSLLQTVQKQDKYIQIAPGGKECLNDQVSSVESKTSTVIDVDHSNGGAVASTAVSSGTLAAVEWSWNSGEKLPVTKANSTIDRNYYDERVEIATATASASSVADLGFLPFSDDTVQTAQGLQLKVVQGALNKHQADVLVNSIHPNADLKKGLVSKSLLESAGSGLQKEIQTKHPAGIAMNSHTVTSGYYLHCKYVIHIALDRYNPGSSEQALHTLICDCLQEADRRGLASIAFPAIGTGNLKFPVGTVADTFLSAVSSFSAQFCKTTLKKVTCVVFDADPHKVFMLKLFEAISRRAPQVPAADRRAGSMQQSASTTAGGRKRHRGTDISDEANFTSIEGAAKPLTERRPPIEKPFDANSSTTLSKGEGLEIELEDMRLQIVVGDIADEETDVIVNSTDSHLSLSGPVSQALVNRGGSEIAMACKAVEKKMKNGVLITAHGSLKCKFLMHLDVGDTKDKDFEKLLTAALLKAEKRKAQSMAMPAIGGSRGEVDALAKGLLEAVSKFCKSKTSRHLHLIRVVMMDESLVRRFLSALRETSESKKNAGFVNTLMTFVGYGPDVKLSEVKKVVSKFSNLCVTIYGISNDAINAAHCDLQNLLDSKKKHKDVKPSCKDDIRLLSDAQVYQITKFGEAKNIQVTVMKDEDCIKVQGYGENNKNIEDTYYDIKDYLKTAARQRQEDQADQDLLHTVQWQHKFTNGEWSMFDPAVNRRLEMASSARQRTLVLSGSGSQTADLIADLTTKTTCNRQGVLTGSLKRIDVLKFRDYPPEWTLDEECKQIFLKRGEEEYEKIESEFMGNVGTSGTEVLEITRFQDPLLWRQYLAQSERIKRSQSLQGHKEEVIERKLWHGTAGDVVGKILSGNFNRSLTGAAALYGRGVYFARDASFAGQPQYAIPDANGDKHVIYAHVLTGEYVKGTPDLRAPPYKNGSPTLTYDSTVDDERFPSIFVVYHDAQAYPMYIIRFR